MSETFHIFIRAYEYKFKKRSNYSQVIYIILQDNYSPDFFPMIVEMWKFTDVILMQFM